jgi:hypothetical protein
MSDTTNQSRRTLLKRLAIGASVLPLLDLSVSEVLAAGEPLVSLDDPTAKALKYTEDASRAAGAKPGSKCSTCALYKGAAGAPQGPCAIFSGKQVKAAGWCASWAPKP